MNNELGAYEPNLIATEVKDAFGNVFSETGNKGTVHYELKKPHCSNVELKLNYTNVGGAAAGRKGISGLVSYPVSCKYVEVEKTHSSSAVDIVNPSSGVPVALQSPAPPHQKHPTQSTPIAPEAIINPSTSVLNGEASEFSPRVFPSSETTAESGSPKIFCGAQQVEFKQKIKEMKQIPLVNQIPSMKQQIQHQMPQHNTNIMQSPSVNMPHLVNQLTTNINVPPPMMHLPPNVNQALPNMNPPRNMQQFVQMKQNQNAPPMMNPQNQLQYSNQMSYIPKQQQQRPMQQPYMNNMGPPMMNGPNQNSLLAIQNQMNTRPPQSKGLNIVVQPSHQVFEQFQPNRNYGDHSQLNHPVNNSPVNPNVPELSPDNDISYRFYK